MSQRLIGKIKDAHGLRGELYVLVFSGDISWLDDIEQIALSSETQKLTLTSLTIVSTKPYKDGFILKSKEISDRTQAESIRGALVSIDEDYLVAEEGETIYLSEIESFEVFVDDKCIGKIVGFSSNGAQDILEVEPSEINEGSSKVYEIPFVDAFVKEIDHDAQKIYLTLPEGLLEINNKD